MYSETSWIPTCADLKSMDDVSTELTTEQINAMSTSEVGDCMTFISSKNIWSDQQYNMWSQKFSQVCYLCLVVSHHIFEKMLIIFHGILFYMGRNEAAQCLDSFSYFR